MFKKRFTEIAVAVAMTMSAGAAQAVVTELAVNGGFGTGDSTGWTFFANGGTMDYSAAGETGFGGNQVSVGTPSNPTLKQANVGAGLLTPGQAVTVSFDWMGSNSDGGVVDVVLFSEKGAGGVSQTDALLQGAPSSAGWTSIGPTTFNIGPDVGGGVTLQFTVICGGAPTCTSDYSWDNVSITADIAAVPVPAAVWLFGSGLLGLIGVARRKKAA
jgi:hypothetical protein